MEGDKGRWFAHGSTGRDDPGHSETSQFLIISALAIFLLFLASYWTQVVACYWLVATQGYLSGLSLLDGPPPGLSRLRLLGHDAT